MKSFTKKDGQNKVILLFKVLQKVEKTDIMYYV